METVEVILIPTTIRLEATNRMTSSLACWYTIWASPRSPSHLCLFATCYLLIYFEWLKKKFFKELKGFSTNKFWLQFRPSCYYCAQMSHERKTTHISSFGGGWWQGKWWVQLRFWEQNLEDQINYKMTLNSHSRIWKHLESCLLVTFLFPHEDRNISAWLLDTTWSVSDVQIMEFGHRRVSARYFWIRPKTQGPAFFDKHRIELREPEHRGSGSLTHPINETLTSQHRLLSVSLRGFQFLFISHSVSLVASLLHLHTTAALLRVD